MRNLNTDTYTHGEHHVKIGVRLPQGKEVPEARKEAGNRSFPNTFKGSIALPLP